MKDPYHHKEVWFADISLWTVHRILGTECDFIVFLSAVVSLETNVGP